MTQFSPNYYIMYIIKPSPIEHWCPGYADSNTINSPLTLMKMPDGFSIFTPDFVNPCSKLFHMQITYHPLGDISLTHL